MIYLFALVCDAESRLHRHFTVLDPKTQSHKSQTTSAIPLWEGT